MTLKDFVDKEHYAYCKKEYEQARHFLKICGRPKDWYDSFLVQLNKDTSNYFRKYSV